MRSLGFAALVMVIACVREPSPPSSSPPPNAVSATPPSSPAVYPATASSSAPVLIADSALAASPVDSSGALRGLSARDSLCGDLAENGLLIPDTNRTVVAARLGRPDSARSHPTPNTHRPVQTDSLVDVFYPGLRLHYIVLGVKEGNTDILQIADVSHNRFLKYPVLGIGAKVGDILSALGEPEERTSDTISYSCALHVMEGATVYFHLEGGLVKSIEYTYYVD